MDPEKNTPQHSEETEISEKPSTHELPADALSRTPEELEQDQAEQAAADLDTIDNPKGAKKPSKLRRFFRRINVYFLFFVLLLVIAAAITIVNYLNSKNITPVEPTIASQELTEDALRQLANTDATVGDASKTLTIQGNAVIEGQTLMRGNLNVAGNIQSGGSIQGPSLTISGASNLNTAQINSLQVASDTAIQGRTTMRDLSVSGASTFSGTLTASQITVTNLVMSGNAKLEVPNHISFTGPTPSRTVNSTVLGAGGSVSMSGSDTSGVVNINTGNSPAAGCFVRINFAQNFPSQPRVIISPVGAAAGRTEYYVDRNNSGFSICASSPAPANQSFAFDYFVAG